MQLKVTGREIAPTRSLTDYVEKRLERIDRHIPRIMDVTVVLRKERQNHVIDVRLNAANLHLKVSGRSTDMYASIDDAISKLERAAIRHKERRIQTPRIKAIRAHRSRAAREMSELPPAEEGSAETEVSAKRISVKPMSVDEALLQLKTLDYHFFVFRDSDDNQMKVLYRRSVGTFGLIEPGEE